MNKTANIILNDFREGKIRKNYVRESAKIRGENSFGKRKKSK